MMSSTNGLFTALTVCFLSYRSVRNAFLLYAGGPPGIVSGTDPPDLVRRGKCFYHQLLLNPRRQYQSLKCGLNDGYVVDS